jgi:hypothetical protein
MIAEFWKQTNTHGRDIQDLSWFQVGENFFPGTVVKKESGTVMKKESGTIKKETE